MTSPTPLPSVAAIPPYPPGRPISAVAREFGLDPARIVKLASNENPLGASPRVAAAIRSAATGVNLYPDFDCHALRSALAASLDLPAGGILPAAGSSELILLAARAWLAPGLKAVIPQYSFASYEGAVRSVGAEPVIVPTRGWAPDLGRMLEAVDAATRIVYLATPNNPTGTALSPDVVEEFAAALPGHVVLVLDEAYRDYLPAVARPVVSRLLARRAGLLVLRTFSKIHGLAALRVGYGIAAAETIGVLRRLQLPFSVGGLAEPAALAALGDTEFVRNGERANRMERARLAAALSAAGFTVLPSEGNFLLVHVGTGARVARLLMARGVIVRPVDNYGLPPWLRVTVGLPAQNEIFLEHLLALVPPEDRSAERA